MNKLKAHYPCDLNLPPLSFHYAKQIANRAEYLCAFCPSSTSGGGGGAWRSGSAMDCHATARGSIPGGNGVFTELHVLPKGQ